MLVRSYDINLNGPCRALPVTLAEAHLNFASFD